MSNNFKNKGHLLHWDEKFISTYAMLQPTSIDGLL